MNGCFLNSCSTRCGIEARIGIVEAGDEPERHHVVLAAVDPRAAVFARGERPAHGVDHFAGSDAPRGHLPQFLHADAVGLRVAVLVELEASDQLLGERAARALGKHNDLGLEIVAGLEIPFRLAGFVDALVVGAHADDAIAFHQQFCAGKSGEDGDAGGLDFFAHPLGKAVQRDHVVAVIAHGRRRDGKLEFAVSREEVDRFLADRRVQRRFFFEAGQQLAHGARIEQRAGETVLADLARFLQDVDIFLGERRVRMLGVVLVDELRKPQRAGQPGGPAADDDHVGLHLRAFDSFDGFAEDDHGASCCDLSVR